MSRNQKLVFVSALLFVTCTAGTAKPEKIWSCGDTKGTTDQVVRQLNGQIEDAWNHLEASKSALEHSHRQEQQLVEAALSRARVGSEYLRIATDRDIAKKTLDSARASSDVKTAMDASSRFNLARQALQRIENQAVKNDLWVNNEKKNERQLSHNVDEADSALQKVAKWRSKSIIAFENSFMPEWPVVENNEVYIDLAVVCKAAPHRVLFLVGAAEQTDYQKNFSGDGIGLAHSVVHPFEIDLERPKGFAGEDGDKVHEKCCFKVLAQSGEDFIGGQLVQRYTGVLSQDGDLADLLRRIAQVKGPPPQFLQAIDVTVEADIKKEIEENDRKSQKE